MSYKPGPSLDMTLSELTASQWGLVTMAQAARIGITRPRIGRMERSGKLERLSRGIYRDTAAPGNSRQWLYVAWLRLDPRRTADERVFAENYDAVASLETAAWLHGLGDFVPEPYRFSVPGRKRTGSAGIRLKLKHYPRESVMICDGIPTTTVEQTIADLVEDHTDFSLISDMFTTASEEAIQRLDFNRLAMLLAPFAARNGFAENDGAALRDELLRPLRNNLKRQLASLASIGPSGDSVPIKELSRMVSVGRIEMALSATVTSASDKVG